MEYTTKGIEERICDIQRIVSEYDSLEDAEIKELRKRYENDCLKFYHRLSM